MAKEQLIFFNADSVQNQILKMRFEMDGYKPNIVMRSSQIYTTLQFVKTGKYGCFLYSSMTDKFSTSNVTGIPLNPPVRIKIGMVWKKSKYISGDMLTFLHFTRMYYKEHPLIEK
ncbi:MAG: LysR family transcriptional regulator substrate-binding protein [Blautia massiliensis (ex Durand et al. 2017)]